MQKKQNKVPASPKKSGVKILIALVLWTVIAVAFYYYSIKAQILWTVHAYMILAIPTLTAAIIINAYFNAKYAKDAEEKPDEALIKKVRSVVKTLIIIGLPPLFCVLVDFIVMWIGERF